MAELSKISWTDHTFNPWKGCTKVSPGCKNCYAETLMDHRYHQVKWGPAGDRIRTSPSLWKEVEKWNKTNWGECTFCSVRGPVDITGLVGVRPTCGANVEDIKPTRQRVFVASLADVCEIHSTILDQWRVDLANLVKKCANLDFLFLTKRPENFNDLYLHLFDGKLPDNLWVGTSVENQDYLWRVEELIKIDAKHLFLSCEPLLGPLDFNSVEKDSNDQGDDAIFYNMLSGSRWTIGGDLEPRRGVDWVIVGGESGHNARSMHPRWALSIRDQCKLNDIPFHFKQWGEWIPAGQKSNMQNEYLPEGTKYHDFGDAVLARVGKNKAGHVLDGQEYKEFPT